MLTVRAHAVLQYCAKVMRANFDEICRNYAIYFEESEFSSTFRGTYCSHIIEISCKRAKFPMALRLGKRNFAQQFIWQAKFRGTFCLLG